MKELTQGQAEKRFQQAVRFTRDVAKDPARADELESEGLDAWLASKDYQVQNPIRRTKTMASQGLQSQLDDLQTAVDSAYGILNDANDVQSSREDLAKAVIDALGELEDFASDTDGDDDQDDSDED